MSYQEKVFGTGDAMKRLNKVIFKNAVDKGILGKYLSLFPGISFGVAYKLLQRIYKFGGQPYVDDFLVRNYKSNFDHAFGKKYGRSMMYATAGCLIGMGEVILLPLDVLKIKSQTNPEAFAGRGLLNIIMKENIKLYRGTLFTMSRSVYYFDLFVLSFFHFLLTCFVFPFISLFLFLVDLPLCYSILK